MNIYLKSQEEIKIMKTGGEKLSRVLEKLIKVTKPGVKLIEIEKLAWDLLIKSGGKPSFAYVPGYKWATCININEGIVHGMPSKRAIKDGDVVSIDIGLLYRGFNTDMCRTIQVGKKDKKTSEFLETGQKALKRAIEKARVGKRIGNISKAIQTTIEEAGYCSMRNLTGHGVGKKLHEPPPIPCFLDKKIEETPLLKKGMTLAIEIIYAAGSFENKTDKDGWTILMSDGKISAVFEKTIAVNGGGSLILTDF
jgi:methionyl aminopeptidase